MARALFESFLTCNANCNCYDAMPTSPFWRSTEVRRSTAGHLFPSPFCGLFFKGGEGDFFFTPVSTVRIEARQRSESYGLPIGNYNFKRTMEKPLEKACSVRRSLLSLSLYFIFASNLRASPKSSALIPLNEMLRLARYPSSLADDLTSMLIDKARPSRRWFGWLILNAQAVQRLSTADCDVIPALW